MQQEHTGQDQEVCKYEENLEEESIIFRTYKIRFFGLTMIALANIASSLNWLAVAPVPDYSNTFFGNAGLTAINWFSNIFMLIYLFAGPLSSWVYDRWSIKLGVRYIPLYFASLYL
jgi:MFS family permease